MATLEYKKITHFEEVPVQQKYRNCTDKLCIYIGISFTAILLILTVILFNNDHYIKTSFPSDSDGRVCGIDLPNHAYVYFTNFPQINNRVCVSQCPQQTDKSLKCIPTKGIGCVFNDNQNFSVSFYANEAQNTGIGYFCKPADQNLKQKLYQDIEISEKYIFFHQIQSMFISAAIAVVLSIIFLVAVQLFSQFMNKFVIIAGLAMIILMVIFTVLQKNINIVILIVFAVVMVFLFLIILIGAQKSKICLDLHGVFLKYSTKVLAEKPLVLIYIPIFTAIFVLFLLMVSIQLKSLWSFCQIQFSPQNVYYQFKAGSTTFFSALVAIQVLWGLSFIQLAFNFCISGIALGWYYQFDDNRSGQSDNSINAVSLFTPIKFLFRYHFGSVVAGAFMDAFFFIFDYIFDIMRCEGNQISCINCIDSCLDLVRTDVMAFIVLTGNPFCNSSRYCELLCYNAPASRYSQSNGRSYRICSHIFIGGLVAIINIYLQGANISVFIIMIVFILSSVISTFFINVHEDANQAIQIYFLFEYSFARDKERPNQKIDENNVFRIQKNIRRTQLAEQVYNEAEKIVNSKIQQRENKQKIRKQGFNS